MIEMAWDEVKEITQGDVQCREVTEALWLFHSKS